MSYNLTQYKYPAVIQFQNDTSQFEVYFGGKIEQAEPGNKIANNIVSFKVLQCQYMIGNTIRTQGLLGEWYDNAGNLWSFAPGGITITSPSGGTRTVTNTTPTTDGVGYAMMLVRYYNNEANSFSIAYGIRIPQDAASATFLRSPGDIDTITEYVTDYFEANVNSIDTKKYAYMPFYNTFTDNDYPIECIGCLWTDTTLDTFEVGLGGSRQLINATTLDGFINPAGENPDDPYQPGGTTTPGGGQGSFDRSSDPIDVPALPLLSAIDTGFVSLWRPSSTELLNLYNYMWSSAFDLESFKKIFANPIDAIMGFGIIPLNPVTGTARALKIGNINTGVNVTPVTEQYYQVDCGTLYLDNYFDTYLEFEPYSTLEIFLPFCGCMQLSADDFYRRKKEYPGGGKINVKYNVDILSGSCVAFISCYDANGATTMTYEFNGNLLTQIPITGNDFSGLYNAVLGIAGNVVSGVAHAATGNAAGILGDVVNAAHNVTSAKPSINRSGTIGGSYGLLANRKPFLIRNIPREAVAWAQNTFQGYPSHITTVIRSINGYTEFEKVYTDNIPASDNELKEIVQILETGVIL